MRWNRGWNICAVSAALKLERLGGTFSAFPQVAGRSLDLGRPEKLSTAQAVRYYLGEAVVAFRLRRRGREACATGESAVSSRNFLFLLLSTFLCAVRIGICDWSM